MRKPSIAILYLAALILLVLTATPGLAADPLPNDLVTLRGSIVFDGAGTTASFERILKDGTTKAFLLPGKKVMVVTDVEWVVDAAVEKNLQFFLYINGTDVYDGAMNLQGLQGPDGRIHGKFSDRLNSGFTIAKAKDLLAEAQAIGQTNVVIYLRGYFSAN